MNEPNASVFHCITCGRIRYEPLGAPSPKCCGRLMAKAFDKEIPDRETKSRKIEAEQESYRKSQAAMVQAK